MKIGSVEYRPARAGENWACWTEQGPMVPVLASVEEVAGAIEALHRQHEVNARRMNEMLSALKWRLGELLSQQPPRPAVSPVPIRPLNGDENGPA